MDYDTEGVAFSNFEYWQICYNEVSKQIGKTHNPSKVALFKLLARRRTGEPTPIDICWHKYVENK